MMMKRKRGKRTRNKRRTTRRFISPATAYAFIIIHKIPRRFCELPALRTGLKRLIEKRKRGGKREGGFLSPEEKNISSKQKQDELLNV